MITVFGLYTNYMYNCCGVIRVLYKDYVTAIIHVKQINFSKIALIIIKEVVRRRPVKT